MQEKFKGIFTELMTPFDENNKINENVLRALVKHNVAMGVDGFIVCGSAAEAALLTIDERKQVMGIVKSAAPEKTLIAQIGLNSEDEAQKLAAYANTLCYDAISSALPRNYRFNFNENKGYYLRLAENSSIPVFADYFPTFSSIDMDDPKVVKFLSDDRIVGLSFTGAECVFIGTTKLRYPKKIVYNGFEDFFLVGLLVGADGGIGSSYNFMADKFVKIRTLVAERRIDEAKALQNEVERIIRILREIGEERAKKEVLNQIGMNLGTRSKLSSPPTDEQKARIAKEIVPYIYKG